LTKTLDKLVHLSGPNFLICVMGIIKLTSKRIEEDLPKY
jgi:hypothetical protein